MKLLMTILSFFALNIALVGAVVSGRCGKESCGPDSCCVIGFQQYSSPQCQPLGDVGDWCHDPDSGQYTEVRYPNDLVDVADHAYQGSCPCKPGLSCGLDHPVCSSGTL